MIKDTIIKYFNNQQLTEQEVIDFLIHHYKRTEDINPPGEALIQLIQMLQMGIISLEPLMKWELQQYPDYRLDILYNKNNQIVYRKFYQIELEKIN